ncbi:hypothetical protein ABJI51_37750 [Amycolatopsis sp. NEAU-NG30]|uniref:ESX-1 secretion-associated protein n=1 Tax=Amycolatopsis melonis TaxID=3156488 RepID=A0ABV0LRB1_9PSEU
MDDAVRHFRARNVDLHDVGNEVHGGLHLRAGYGKTGGYQRGLENFSAAFEKVFDEFLADEDAFCLFLEGFRDRLRQAAGTYQATEARATESLNRIATQLGTADGPRP